MHDCCPPCARRLARAAAGVPRRAGAADGAAGGGAGQRAHRERRGGACRRAAGQSPVRRAATNAILSHESRQARDGAWLLAQPSRALRPWWATAQSARASCSGVQGIGLGFCGRGFLGHGLHAVLLISRVCTTGWRWLAFARLTGALCGSVFESGWRMRVPWARASVLIYQYSRCTALIHWHCRATLVGERTFGKGVVQYYFPTAGDRQRRSGGVAAPADGSGLKVTVAKYITAGARRPAARFCAACAWLVDGPSDAGSCCMGLLG